MGHVNLSESEAKQIAEILGRRANEIAMFNFEHKELPASVEFGLTRDINRLRALAEKIYQPPDESEDE